VSLLEKNSVSTCEFSCSDCRCCKLRAVLGSGEQRQSCKGWAALLYVVSGEAAKVVSPCYVQSARNLQRRGRCATSGDRQQSCEGRAVVLRKVGGSAAMKGLCFCKCRVCVTTMILLYDGASW
jgi:hypothetical protein